jgi:hypothetical protein
LVIEDGYWRIKPASTFSLQMGSGIVFAEYRTRHSPKCTFERSVSYPRFGYTNPWTVPTLAEIPSGKRTSEVAIEQTSTPHVNALTPLRCRRVFHTAAAISTAPNHSDDAYAEPEDSYGRKYGITHATVTAARSSN